MNGTYSASYVEQSARDKNLLIAQVTTTLVDGGGTWIPFGDYVEFDSGYIVGGIVDTVRIKSDGTDLESAFSQFQHRFPHNAGGTRYFGTWLDANGVIHLDVVERIDNLQDAARIAAERGEIAIWDCLHNTEIFTANVK